MIAHYAIRVTLWLLVGCGMMLFLNEYRPISRVDFVVGMIVWPAPFLVFGYFFCQTVWRGARGRR